jgi:hypothetical protein
MPMAMKNLIIVQHWDMLCYVIIWGGGYWFQVHKLHLGDCMYLHKTTLIMLNLIMEHVILHVWKVLLFKVLLVEDKDGQTWKNHVHSCILCHLPNVDSQIDPSLFVVHVGLCCNVVRAILRGNHYIKFIIDVLKDDLWDVLCHHWKKY